MEARPPHDYEFAGHASRLCHDDLVRVNVTETIDLPIGIGSLGTVVVSGYELQAYWEDILAVDGVTPANQMDYGVWGHASAIAEAFRGIDLSPLTVSVWDGLDFEGSTLARAVANS